MSTGYNGWTNYETWNVNLWIDNEYGSYKRKQSFLRAHSEDMNESDVEQFCIDEFGLKTPDGDSLSEVNWAELCEAWKYEAKEAEQCT